MGAQLGMTPFNDVRFALLGGSIVDANALLRAYIWHCIAIPLIASIFMGVHFWRVRKDGGISGPAPVMLEGEMKPPARRGEAAILEAVMDWAQLWAIVSQPDNIPIVALAILVPFYAWLGLRQARATDRLIEQLEASPELAKTHHRKIYPFRPGWARELQVWPYLLRIEFLAAVIVTLVLMVWSITLNAPLEEPANPNHTMNPAKAPWYFVGLQEMLVYFDPWFAGVVLPTLIVVGLMVFPYIDTNPLGVGYYTIRQRVVSLVSYGARVLPVAVADLHRHVCPRPWLDVVLARKHLGPHAGDLRGEPQSAGHAGNHEHVGQNRSGPDCRGPLLRSNGLAHSQARHAIKLRTKRSTSGRACCSTGHFSFSPSQFSQGCLRRCCSG